MDKVKYGIVGFGKQGSLYTLFFTKLKFMLKGAKLCAICDTDPKKREQASKVKGIKVFDNHMDMFKSGLINTVIICTPHYFHPPIAIDAFKAGLNVLCDKPAGVYTKQVREMIDESKKHPDLLFGMMFNQRTNPLYIKAKELIDSGRLGNITRVNWIITNWYRPKAYYSQGGWRGTWWGEGGGVLLNQCPHQLDLFTWLAGIPEKVSANIETVGRDINVENEVTATCKFKNGATGAFITSTHDTPGTNRLEIDGDGGQIVVEGKCIFKYKNIMLEGGKLIFRENKEMEPAFSEHNKIFMGSPKVKKHTYKGTLHNLRLFKYPPQHMGVLKNYTDYLLKKTDKFIAPGEEGINGLTFSNAIHLAGWTKKEVLVPFDEDLFIEDLEKRKEEEKLSSKK